jgi:hypothetical protein
LRRTLASEKDLTIQLLPEDQLFISKHLMRTVETAATKAPGLVPEASGYSIHIKAARTGATPLPQQRSSDSVKPLVWGVDTISLSHPDDSLDERWVIRNRDDVRFSLSVRCGSTAVFHEVDRVLAAVGRALFEGGANA